MSLFIISKYSASKIVATHRSKILYDKFHTLMSPSYIVSILSFSFYLYAWLLKERLINEGVYLPAFCQFDYMTKINIVSCLHSRGTLAFGTLLTWLVKRRKLRQLLRLWYLSQRWPPKAQASLRIRSLTKAFAVRTPEVWK